MVPALFFYQLVLIALLWLCVMLQWAWPRDSTACPTPPAPPPRPPKRQREPKPFAGLTTKPHCDACVHVSAPRPQAPCAPPPRIVMTRGRRRQVDTSHHVTQVLVPDCAPLFLPDGFREYMTALVTHYGQWVQPVHQRVHGPAPQPRWTPLPGLLYAQVVKTVRRRRLVRVRHRVVFGTLEAVNQMLAPLGWQSSTAFVERVNLSIRQHVAAVGRRGPTLCKGEDGMQQQFVLYQVYYNFCLPHPSVR